MQFSLEVLVWLASLAGSAYAVYTAIKKTGATEMKSNNEIEALKSKVSDLTTRLAVAESCNTKNDKAIEVIQTDIDWIKKGIDEIKELIQGRA